MIIDIVEKYRCCDCNYSRDTKEEMPKTMTCNNLDIAIATGVAFSSL